ncbi:PilW family protein [Myxococcota bacterium]|nr:PilW family protein [Myxococcota bacterium]MBU1380792.1 PilW family protein [Myxococcota bacterium]MBU1498926.1 PilW family protein [Myxococcota bacterium]
MKHLTLKSGFTLIELMIAIFISSLVIAGAFNVQLVFTQTARNQEEVSDLQNSLDGLKNYMHRALKGSGAGLAANIEIRACDGSTQVVPAINIHNNNSYPVVSDFTDGGIDNDPDWIEFIYTGNVEVTSVFESFDASYAKVYSSLNFAPRDVVAVNVGAYSCIRRINTVINTIPNYLGWYSRGGVYCLNPSNNSHPSCGYAGGSITPSKTVTITKLGEFPFQALRVDTTTYARPVLMHGTRREQSGGSTYTWTPLVENVEDMQIAWLMDTSDPMDKSGDLWINSRDPQPLEYGRIRSLRISIITRSNAADNKIKTARPAYEDRQAGALDNYYRRKITFIVNIPNRPITGGTL